MATRAGRRRLKLRRPGRIAAAAAVLLLFVLFFGRSVAVFYTDALWYSALGHGAVFWTQVLARLAVRAVMGALGAALILINLWYVLRQLGPVHLRRRYGNLEIAEQVPRAYLIAGAVIVALLAGWWLSGLQFGGNTAVSILAWVRSESWGISDPLFGRDLSFYVFGLPVYRRFLEYLLIVLVWSIMLVAIGYALVGAVRVSGSRWEIDDRPRVHFAALIAALLVVIGTRYLLGRYTLLLDGGGFRGTIGYTDIVARLPARLVLGLLAFVAAGAIVYGTIRRSWTPPATALGLFLVAAAGMGMAYPAIVQKLRVEPNQLVLERDYIAWNIEYTRRAFGLDRITPRRLPYRRADGAAWAAMTPVLERLALWDPDQLRAAFRELQAKRGYYHFPEVDFDRTGPAGARRQFAISVREFNPAERTQSMGWQNEHLNPLFTRGLGVVVVPTERRLLGGPVYWLSELPPQRHVDAPPNLELREPSIYFGETMDDYAVIGHNFEFQREAETTFQLPPTPRVTTGVPLNSFARVLAFAWAFGEQNLLFSDELGDTSRILFRRTVTERLETLAPFLLWDSDAQPVVIDGRVLWIVDGYTHSASYPLSRPYPQQTPSLPALRYIRGAVKATVDAVSGEVALYAVTDPDPILRTYRALFPGLIRNWSDMPESVRAHLRYPALLFRLQADVLQDYHVDRPDALYDDQDAWQLPQDPDGQQLVFGTSYLLSTLPGETVPEFLLLYPFVARERQNMTALLIARSDPPNYGELALLDLPRDDQVRGPAQVEAIIEADPAISQQLSWWRQQGSTVALGRLRILPSDSSVLYVQPVFLVSSASNAIPQLQRVIVTDGTRVAMAEDITNAAAILAGDVVLEPRPAPPTTESPPGASAGWTERAVELLREADARLRAGDFAGFGAAWSELKKLLEQHAGGAASR